MKPRDDLASEIQRKLCFNAEYWRVCPTGETSFKGLHHVQGSAKSHLGAKKLVFVSAPRVGPCEDREGGVLLSGVSLPPSKAPAAVTN